MSGRHEPVLLQETLGFLCNGPGLYLDATLGDGGHAEGLLLAEPKARLLGCDRDPRALEFARERLWPFGDRVSMAQARFVELPAVHRRHGGEPLAGALLDLGVSSRQLDDPQRGMSFTAGGPLDMRMDPGAGEGAAERLARVDEAELAEVLRTHGDVPHAGRLSRAMVAEARAGRLTTTHELVRLVERTLGRRPPPRYRAQVFQALRIWVNGEAEDLEAVLAWLPSSLRPGGTVVTLAYHSGEDRRIKRALRGTRRVFPSRRRPPRSEERPPEGPWEELTPRVVTPTRDEVAANPRGRSARLRAFRRRVR